MIARIVPMRRSRPPQLGIVVRVPVAGLRQISCEPRDWRSNSQPSDFSFRFSYPSATASWVERTQSLRAV